MPAETKKIRVNFTGFNLKKLATRNIKGINAAQGSKTHITLAEELICDMVKLASSVAAFQTFTQKPFVFSEAQQREFQRGDSYRIKHHINLELKDDDKSTVENDDKSSLENGDISLERLQKWLIEKGIEDERLRNFILLCFNQDATDEFYPSLVFNITNVIARILMACNFNPAQEIQDRVFYNTSVANKHTQLALDYRQDTQLTTIHIHAPISVMGQSQDILPFKSNFVDIVFTIDRDKHVDITNMCMEIEVDGNYWLDPLNEVAVPVLDKDGFDVCYEVKMDRCYKKEKYTTYSPLIGTINSLAEVNNFAEISKKIEQILGGKDPVQKQQLFELLQAPSKHSFFVENNAKITLQKTLNLSGTGAKLAKKILDDKFIAQQLTGADIIRLTDKHLELLHDELKKAQKKTWSFRLSWVWKCPVISLVSKNSSAKFDGTTLDQLLKEEPIKVKAVTDILFAKNSPYVNKMSAAAILVACKDDNEILNAVLNNKVACKKIAAHDQARLDALRNKFSEVQTKKAEEFCAGMTRAWTGNAERFAPVFAPARNDEPQLNVVAAADQHEQQQQETQAFLTEAHCKLAHTSQRMG